jgi:hypothetical protein
MRHTDVFNERGELLVSTIGIDPEDWPDNWHIAIEFERVVTQGTTTRLEWSNVVAIIERGKPARHFK